MFYASHNAVRFYALHNTVRFYASHNAVRFYALYNTVRFYVSIPIHFSSPQSYPTLSARKMIYAMKDGVLLYIVVRSFKSVDEDGYYRSQSSVISYLC